MNQFGGSKCFSSFFQIYIFLFTWKFACLSILASGFVFWVSFMSCFGELLSQLSRWVHLLPLDLGIILCGYANTRVLSTLGDQSFIRLLQEWGMFVVFPYGAVACHGMFLLTPPHLWEWTSASEIPTLIAWQRQGYRRISKNHAELCLGQMIINRSISKTRKTKANKIKTKLLSKFQKWTKSKCLGRSKSKQAKTQN